MCDPSATTRTDRAVFDAFTGAETVYAGDLDRSIVVAGMSASGVPQLLATAPLQPLGRGRCGMAGVAAPSRATAARRAEG